MSLKTALDEAQYGKPVCAVEILGVGTKRHTFNINDPHTAGGVWIIEKFGHSIHVAKGFVGGPWYLTDRRILVRGRVDGLPSVKVIIWADNNLDFFSRRCSCDASKVKEGSAVGAQIDGLRIEEGKAIIPSGEYPQIIFEELDLV